MSLMKVALRRAYEIINMKFCKYCGYEDHSPPKPFRQVYRFISREAAKFTGEDKS
jgi:hypothetical protein